MFVRVLYIYLCFYIHWNKRINLIKAILIFFSEMRIDEKIKQVLDNTDNEVE